MEALYLITARGGSKGLPGKNIRPLAGKPLLHYSIEFARQFAKDEDICLSTDDELIINSANDIALEVPFVRPKELALDNTGSYDVILHALNYYSQQNIKYDAVVLLQPTTPFRKVEDLKEMLKIYSNNLDAVVSVSNAKDNPYFNLYFENDDGWLTSGNRKDIMQRQNAPSGFYLNGSVYILNVASIEKYPSITAMPLKKKYVMDQIHSVDIDTLIDFKWCEFLINENLAGE